MGWAIKGGFDVRRRVLAGGSAPHCCWLLQIFATLVLVRIKYAVGSGVIGMVQYAIGTVVVM